MTPTAVTPAGGTTKGERSSGHRSKVRQPTVPRRVSGPRGGVVRPGTAPPRAPRPVRRRSRQTARANPRGSLARRTAVFVAGLPDHPWLDRIVRGRYWIPILGVLLAGIVAMQVEVLKLSANMGRAIERGTALQSRNEQLRASVAALSDDQRIERLAAAMGMVMPDPSAIDFLQVNPSADIRHALSNIHQPDASAFIGSLPAIDTPAGAAAAASSTGVTPLPGQTVSTGTVGPTDSVASPSSTLPATSPGTTPVTSTPGVATTPSGG